MVKKTRDLLERGQNVLSCMRQVRADDQHGARHERDSHPANPRCVNALTKTVIFHFSFLIVFYFSRFFFFVLFSVCFFIFSFISLFHVFICFIFLHFSSFFHLLIFSFFHCFFIFSFFHFPFLSNNFLFFFRFVFVFSCSVFFIFPLGASPRHLPKHRFSPQKS